LGRTKFKDRDDMPLCVSPINIGVLQQYSQDGHFEQQIYRTKVTRFDTCKADGKKSSEVTATKNHFLVHKCSTDKMGEADLR
jgi:hypothetical protein